MPNYTYQFSRTTNVIVYTVYCNSTKATVLCCFMNQIYIMYTCSVCLSTIPCENYVRYFLHINNYFGAGKYHLKLVCLESVSTLSPRTPHISSCPFCSHTPHIQVLSSRLMPTGIRERETDDSTTQSFRRTFLECSGLKFVINVLQKNALPSDVDLTVRQDCYAISLSLAR